MTEKSHRKTQALDLLGDILEEAELEAREEEDRLSAELRRREQAALREAEEREERRKREAERRLAEEEERRRAAAERRSLAEQAMRQVDAPDEVEVPVVAESTGTEVRSAATSRRSVLAPLLAAVTFAGGTMAALFAFGVVGADYLDETTSYPTATALHDVLTTAERAEPIAYLEPPVRVERAASRPAPSTVRRTPPSQEQSSTQRPQGIVLPSSDGGSGIRGRQ